MGRYVLFKWYFEKSGSVGRWETNQFVGIALVLTPETASEKIVFQ